MGSAGLWVIFQNPYSWELLITYWILMSPLAGLFLMIPKDKLHDWIPIFAPFNVDYWIRKMDRFLKPAQKAIKILFLFKDPADQ